MGTSLSTASQTVTAGPEGAGSGFIRHSSFLLTEAVKMKRGRRSEKLFVVLYYQPTAGICVSWQRRSAAVGGKVSETGIKERRRESSEKRSQSTKKCKYSAVLSFLDPIYYSAPTRLV